MSAIVTPDLTARLAAGMESELAEEERRYAAQSIRTVRLINDLSSYRDGVPMYLIQRNGQRHTIAADFAVEHGHPILTVSAGETITYQVEQEEPVTMTLIGLFDVVAVATTPGESSDRITFMAEHLQDAA